MQPLDKFIQRETLTASKLNKMVDAINDHERRIRAQKLNSGVGYKMTQSETGTQLTIVRSGGSGGDSYTHPFKVYCTGGDFYSESKQTDCNFAISATSGTVFGTGGSSSNYQYIDASEDNRDDEDKCRLYAYINVEEEGDYMVFANLKVQALASMPFAEDDNVNTSLASVLAVAIPFDCEFQRIDAETLSKWEANGKGDVGGIVIEKPENDDEYGLGSVYEVHFPLAIINFEKTGEETGDLSQGNIFAVKKITQILHSDIYWYGHKTRSI